MEHAYAPVPEDDGHVVAPAAAESLRFAPGARARADRWWARALAVAVALALAGGAYAAANANAALFSGDAAVGGSLFDVCADALDGYADDTGFPPRAHARARALLAADADVAGGTARPRSVAVALLAANLGVVVIAGALVAGYLLVVRRASACDAAA